MRKMSKWTPEEIAKPEEVDIMVRSVFQELDGADPGDYSVMVGADTLIIGLMDGDGTPNVYECSIRKSTENALDIPLESELPTAKSLAPHLKN